MYYVAFDIDRTGLNMNYNLHFDLYNTDVKRDGTIIVDDFAPFSHDAGAVPEPAAVFMLGPVLTRSLGMDKKVSVQLTLVSNF